MTDVPRLCRCHGEPMRNNGHRNGQIKWACAVKKRARNREAQRRYQQTEHGRATATAYNALPHRALAKRLHQMASVPY